MKVGCRTSVCPYKSKEICGKREACGVRSDVRFLKLLSLCLLIIQVYEARRQSAVLHKMYVVRH
jgi:hypothetical protein